MLRGGSATCPRQTNNLAKRSEDTTADAAEESGGNVDVCFHPLVTNNGFVYKMPPALNT